MAPNIQYTSKSYWFCLLHLAQIHPLLSISMTIILHQLTVTSCLKYATACSSPLQSMCVVCGDKCFLSLLGYRPCSSQCSNRTLGRRTPFTLTLLRAVNLSISPELSQMPTTHSRVSHTAPFPPNYYSCTFTGLCHYLINVHLTN